MPLGKRFDLTVPAGVNKDDVSYTAQQYVDAQNFRFYRYYPQKIGGWKRLLDKTRDPNVPFFLNGVPRSMYSITDVFGRDVTLIGTTTGLYAELYGSFYDITPVTASSAMVLELSTNFSTVANNSITTTEGESIVTMDVGTIDVNAFLVGDTVLVSGVVGDVGGIPQASLIGTFITTGYNYGQNTIAFDTGIVATSSASGGGNAITLGCQLITATLDSVAGVMVYENVFIQHAVDMTGFTANELNVNGEIRTVYPMRSQFIYVAGGGGSTSLTNQTTMDMTAQFPIAAGFCDIPVFGGYGAGNYNDGSYNTDRDGDNNVLVAYPQIWSFDRFGSSVIMTPGSQSAIYIWSTLVSDLPVRLDSTMGSSDVPQFVNYVFTANSQVITFGGNSSGDNQTPNFLATSAILQNNNFSAITSFSTTLEGSGQLIAHAFVKDKVVLFTQNKVSEMIWSDSGQKWIITDILSTDGLIGPKAVISFNDSVVWIGQSNWYSYNGAVVSVLPNNNVRQWFYEIIDKGMWAKTFLMQNISFNEIWVFFPSDNTDDYVGECNNYVIWSYQEGHYTPGKMNRTCSENPTDVNRPQYLGWGYCGLTDENYPSVGPNGGYIYEQELGDEGYYAADGEDMVGYLVTNYAQLDDGEMTLEIERFIPSNIVLPLDDASQNQLLYTVQLFTKDYDLQPIARVTQAFPVYANTQKIESRTNGRQFGYRYDFSNQIGFRIEKTLGEFKPTTKR